MAHLSNADRDRGWIRWICLFCLAASACGGDPRVNSFEAKVSFDSTVRKFVQRFELAILRSTTANGAPLTCGDIPQPFPFGDRQLRLIESKRIPWSGQQTEAQIPPIEVPAEQPLVIAVQGTAPWLGDGVHAVARGCVEGAMFAKGADATVRVDAKATVGRSCSAATDCEPTLTICLQGDHFPDGYCTISGCITDEQCPSGSRCVTGGSGNICARECAEATADCETASAQECAGRLGPGGCAKVCVHPLWSAGGAC